VVSFVGSRQFFGLPDPTVAGKATLISILAGLARATTDRVLVHRWQRCADRLPDRPPHGVVPQELVFDPFFNVHDLAHPDPATSASRRNDAWIGELLRSGPHRQTNANMRQLSGGMAAVS
jgi:ABC-2 type transport system ATP-binding protein